VDGRPPTAAVVESKEMPQALRERWEERAAIMLLTVYLDLPRISISWVELFSSMQRYPMSRSTGMQLYDTQGHRLYLTCSEREAFRKAAETAPREIRTYGWPLLYTGCR
jgi:hypothetical protein